MNLCNRENCLKLTIPVKPRTKKNSQQIFKAGNKRLIGPSKAYTSFERLCGCWIGPKDRVKFDFPVNVRVQFFVDSARRVDLTNLLEAIDDILVKCEVLADDSADIIVSHDGSRVFIDREKPRIEIDITPMEYYYASPDPEGSERFDKVKRRARKHE